MQVTLELAEWQSVMQILQNAAVPWVVSHPLIAKIDGQLAPQLQQRQQQQPGQAPGNGADEVASTRATSP